MACQAALVIVLVAKRAWNAFPIFFSYSALTFFAAFFMYVIRGKNQSLYFYSYWALESAGIALGFAVVYEIFENLFSTHLALRKLATLLFKYAIVALFAIGIIVLVRQSPTGWTSFGTAVGVVEEAARIIEVGLLMCLFLFATAFGLHWREQLFGIALGLGLFIAVELITAALRVQAGTAAYSLLNIVRISAFNVSLLVWLGYFLAPERAASRVELPEQSQLEQWNQAVMELIRQ